MTRPPSTLRLIDIDPGALDRDLSAALAHHVARLALPLSPGLTVHVAGPHGDTGIGLTAADLARYARGEGDLDDAVESYAVELVPLLASPLDPPSGPLPALLTAWLAGEVNVSDLDPSSLPDRLALVLTAALGREAVETGRPVTVAQLAALAGLDPNSVRRLARAGELDTTDGAVSARDARRWLKARGVPGL
jgi:hypothetical protein